MMTLVGVPLLSPTIKVLFAVKNGSSFTDVTLIVTVPSAGTTEPEPVAP